MKEKMKLGNISQSIVPIPKFFTDKTIRTIEIFKDSDFTYKKFNNRRKKSYFRSGDLFTSTRDINFSNNPRTVTIFKENSEEKKYIPIYDRSYYANNAEIKETYFPDIINRFKVKPLDVESNKNEYKNLLKYFKSTDFNYFLKPNLRQEIMDNTKNLIDRINITYDLKQWNEFKSRETMNKIFQTAYSPLTDVIQKTKNYKEDFIKILHNKTLGLKTITEKSKMILKRYIKSNDKNIRSRTIRNNNISKNKSDLDRLLETNKSNLLSLKSNNREPIEYSKESKEFIEQNKSITNSVNDSIKLYKYFPSKTRKEFNLKKIFPRKKKNTTIDDWGVIEIDKYKSKKENFSSLDKIWTRPLHSDAYKIIK